MDGRINVAEAPEIMVSPRPPNPVEKANPAWMPRPNSPLEITPHKASNGDDPITCRDRHCPKCHSLARAKWLEKRQAELLQVEYFHVVFTLPEPLAKLSLQNKRQIYDLLFRATAETLQAIAADPKHLGAQIGFFYILHTWGQTLTVHPHLHCVVPGGGISLDGGRWVACRPGFFLPVKVLSQRFRNVYLRYLEQAYAAGKLQFHGELEPLSDPQSFARYLAPLRDMEWVVYAKPPFGGPERVLDYLGRYT